jgi:iron complex transport system permease protein
VALRLAGLAAFALAATCASLLFGSTAISLHDLVAALAHPGAHNDLATIVWQLRMPRSCAAAIVGLTLSIAGLLLQGMLRNPLADPSLIGVSAGAVTAIVLALLLGVSLAITPLIGFVAGLATAAVVAALSRRGSGIDVNRLILAGVSVSALLSSLITLSLVRSSSLDSAQQIVAWLAGSLAGRNWSDVRAATPYGVAGLAIAALAVPALNALRIGDVRARTVGLAVDRAQWLILASVALLTSCAVSLAGIVGFVGLIVPHLARRIVGSDARLLLPASALCGIGLATIADTACRTIAPPSELPLGVLLAFIGVPVFLYIYLHRERVT